MPAPKPSDLQALLKGTWRAPDIDRAAAELEVITALAKSYTRGQGFDSDGNPNGEIRAVILTAAARFHTHPGQVRMNIVKGPKAHRSAKDSVVGVLQRGSASTGIASVLNSKCVQSRGLRHPLDWTF